MQCNTHYANCTDILIVQTPNISMVTQSENSFIVFKLSINIFLDKSYFS